jgi:hypothetical protein
VSDDTAYFTVSVWLHSALCGHAYGFPLPSVQVLCTMTYGDLQQNISCFHDNPFGRLSLPPPTRSVLWALPHPHVSLGLTHHKRHAFRPINSDTLRGSPCGRVCNPRPDPILVSSGVGSMTDCPPTPPTSGGELSIPMLHGSDGGKRTSGFGNPVHGETCVPSSTGRSAPEI